MPHATHVHTPPPAGPCPRRWRTTLATGLAALLLQGLVACGGGEPAGEPSQNQDPTLQPQSVQDVVETDAQAARFLTQATYGPNMAAIADLKAVGYSNWLTRQFAEPIIDTHWDYVARKGPLGCVTCVSIYINATMETFWLHALEGRDQLRQRVVLALAEQFVVSTVNSPVSIEPDAHAAYLDMLERHAFGNFRALIEDVARHPTMGYYLSHIRNRKEDEASGRTPDENFARELMQLFTIGLWEIDDYGQRKKDGQNQDIPTYDLADVMGMARVFTGLSWAAPDQSDKSWGGGNGWTWNQPMQMYPQHHSTGEKVFLNTRIPARSGTITQAQADAELKTALDTLFAHPNVPAFFGKQLIKRLVTSNPSPAYVWRVAQAFKDNGRGVRGDMQAVIRAVLMDPDARNEAKIADPQWGKLREPMVRYANFLRAFQAWAPSRRYSGLWNLEDPVGALGQNPQRAPSVFNWYQPEYSPQWEDKALTLSAPEFQITNETTLTGYVNFMDMRIQRSTWRFANNNPDAMQADYSAEIALAADPDKLLDRLNILLMSGQMTAGTRSVVKTAMERITRDYLNIPRDEMRTHMAIRLMMASPEYLIQK